MSYTKREVRHISHRFQRRTKPGNMYRKFGEISMCGLRYVGGQTDIQTRWSQYFASLMGFWKFWKSIGIKCSYRFKSKGMVALFCLPLSSLSTWKSMWYHKTTSILQLNICEMLTCCVSWFNCHGTRVLVLFHRCRVWHLVAHGLVSMNLIALT